MLLGLSYMLSSLVIIKKWVQVGLLTFFSMEFGASDVNSLVYTLYSTDVNPPRGPVL